MASLQMQGADEVAGAAAERELPNQPLRAPFSNKILVFKPAAPNWHSASCSPALQPYWGLYASGSITAQIVSPLQAPPSSPIPLVMTQKVSTVSVGEHCPCASATSSLFLPETSSIQVHPGVSLSSLFGRGGEGAPDLALFQDSCRRLGRHQAWGCSSPGPHTGPRDITVPKKSPYRLFFNVLYNFGL